jgi:hypothetical protein
MSCGNDLPGATRLASAIRLPWARLFRPFRPHVWCSAVTPYSEYDHHLPQRESVAAKTRLLVQVSRDLPLSLCADESGVRSSAIRRCRLKPELQTATIFIEVAYGPIRHAAAHENSMRYHRLDLWDCDFEASISGPCEIYGRRGADVISRSADS